MDLAYVLLAGVGGAVVTKSLEWFFGRHKEDRDDDVAAAEIVVAEATASKTLAESLDILSRSYSEVRSECADLRKMLTEANRRIDATEARAIEAEAEVVRLRAKHGNGASQ